MRTIPEIIHALKQDWSTPVHAVHRGQETMFTFICDFSPEGVSVDNDFPYAVPEDLKAFWSIASTADLFKDSEYGQWGLQLLSPEEALSATREQKEWRADDFEEQDLVIGRFLGDSDLLVLSTGDGVQPNVLRIALPIDPRKEWPAVGPGFTAFLDKYTTEQGDKYWEP